MGLENTQRSCTFIRIRYGKMPVRVKEPTKTSVEYEYTRGPNAGKIVHEELFDKLTGKIIDIYWREHKEYGRTWCVLVQDKDEEMFQLEFDYSSRYTSGFFTRLENCDLSREISFRTFAIKDDETGKLKYYGTIEQDGEKITPKYTKENPNGLPPMEKKFFNGKEQWDSFEQTEFFRKLIEKLRPVFQRNIGRAAKHEEPHYEPEVRSNFDGPPPHTEEDHSDFNLPDAYPDAADLEF